MNFADTLLGAFYLLLVGQSIGSVNNDVETEALEYFTVFLLLLVLFCLGSLLALCAIGLALQAIRGESKDIINLGSSGDPHVISKVLKQCAESIMAAEMQILAERISQLNPYDVRGILNLIDVISFEMQDALPTSFQTRKSTATVISKGRLQTQTFGNSDVSDVKGSISASEELHAVEGSNILNGDEEIKEEIDDAFRMVSVRMPKEEVQDSERHSSEAAVDGSKDEAAPLEEAQSRHIEEIQMEDLEQPEGRSHVAYSWSRFLPAFQVFLLKILQSHCFLFRTPQWTYRCRKCGAALFHDFDVLPHQKGGQRQAGYGDWRSGAVAAAAAGDEINCTSMFVQPMKWMGDISTQSGRLICGNNLCKQKLGGFSWHGLPCSCGEWQSPAFQIHNARLDCMPADRTARGPAPEAVFDAPEKI
eukprot:symbB.v1.2.032297.t1/scaffold3817.1/size49779/1